MKVHHHHDSDDSDDENDYTTADVRYLMDGTLSQEVVPARIKIYSFATHARRRSKDDAARPSLLSPSHALSYTPPVVRAKKRNVPKGLAAKLLEASNWDPASKKSHPVFLWFAKERKKNDRGWLRRLEAKIAGREEPKAGSQLLDPEKRFLVDIETLRQVLPTNYAKQQFPLADHAYAWGIKQNSVKRIFMRTMQRNNDVTRKRRSDRRRP